MIRPRALRCCLGNYGFMQDEIAWQDAILLESCKLLEGLTAESVVTSGAFAAYRGLVHAPMMSLADRAGAAQVDATHAAMKNLRPKLTDDEWNRLRVIMIGPRQPRHDYAATQYFAALFPDRGNTLFPGESRRVFYVESPSIDKTDRTFDNERRAVSSMILDEAAAETMFKNPYRMSIDIAADGARRRIAELDLASLR